jgi:phosphoglycerate dehydrogenase-like enzyme
VTPDTVLPAGFSRLESPERLYALLEESDGVVVCCQWTPETTKLIGPEAFAAMKRGAILVNVARGEIRGRIAAIHAVATHSVSRNLGGRSFSQWLPPGGKEKKSR